MCLWPALGGNKLGASDGAEDPAPGAGGGFRALTDHDNDSGKWKLLN